MPRQGLVRLIWNIVVPPNPVKARWAFGGSPHFGFLRFYLFMWRFRVQVSLKLLREWYGRGAGS